MQKCQSGEKRPMNGAQSLFKALVDAGITTCFANPGTSEMQLVYEIGMTDKVRPVLCLQEDVVTGAADGYGRMTGAPAFTLLQWQRLRQWHRHAAQRGPGQYAHRQCRRRERFLSPA